MATVLFDGNMEEEVFCAALLKKNFGCKDTFV